MNVNGFTDFNTEIKLKNLLKRKTERKKGQEKS